MSTRQADTIPVVLVTGATGGLGAAFAEYFASRGWAIVLSCSTGRACRTSLRTTNASYPQEIESDARQPGSRVGSPPEFKEPVGVFRMPWVSGVLRVDAHAFIVAGVPSGSGLTAAGC